MDFAAIPAGCIHLPHRGSFIQSSEEKWFVRYGTTIMATVTGFDTIKGFNWRIFGRLMDYRAHLEWHSSGNEAGSEPIYQYALRVREQKLPQQGTSLPIVIDPDDPSFYLKKDIKDSISAHLIQLLF